MREFDLQALHHQHCSYLSCHPAQCLAVTSVTDCNQTSGIRVHERGPKVVPMSACRRYEMVFEYTPTSDVLVESFWSFSIPSQGIVVPFLLVGHVTEPRVTLDRPAINFGRVSAIS